MKIKIEFLPFDKRTKKEMTQRQKDIGGSPPLAMTDANAFTGDTGEREKREAASSIVPGRGSMGDLTRRENTLKLSISEYWNGTLIATMEQYLLEL